MENLNKDENSKLEPNNLRHRIENLVVALENIEDVIKTRLSFRYALMRGILQGLGFVIGSTIVAGILYLFITQFISPDFIKNITLDEVTKTK